jgi:hypothetical protein
MFTHPIAIAAAGMVGGVIFFFGIALFLSCIAELLHQLALWFQGAISSFTSNAETRNGNVPSDSNELLRAPSAWPAQL